MSNSQSVVSLVALAKQINSLNAGVVEQMVQSGKLLLQAKATLLKASAGKRGGFQDWVKQNLKITPQTATRYMRLAKARNPLRAYATQTRVMRKRAKPNSIASNWGTMSPLNRAKAAFNGLEPGDRQEFLKWITEQFEEKPEVNTGKKPVGAARQQAILA